MVTEFNIKFISCMNAIFSHLGVDLSVHSYIHTHIYIYNTVKAQCIFFFMYIRRIIKFIQIFLLVKLQVKFQLNWVCNPERPILVFIL